MDDGSNQTYTRGFGEGAEDVLRHARAIGNDVTELAQAIGGLAATARQTVDLERRIREKPAQTLLIAAGVGYIAGGGFFTPLTGRLLRVGARLWLIPALRNTLINKPELH